MQAPLPKTSVIDLDDEDGDLAKISSGVGNLLATSSTLSAKKGGSEDDDDLFALVDDKGGEKGSNPFAASGDDFDISAYLAKKKAQSGGGLFD